MKFSTTERIPISIQVLVLGVSIAVMWILLFTFCMPANVDAVL